MSLRAGVLVDQDGTIEEVLARFAVAEELGFDFAYVADHSRDWKVPDAPWHDGPSVLAAAARETTRIRIGTLVANPILRAPDLLAREAHALDHLSGGRLEIGIGTGIAGWDFAASGREPWTRAERARRFAEYVEVVDGVLRAGEEGFSFDGRHHRTAHGPLRPPTPQRPRPPLTLGGQSPTVRRIAARLADCWNTHGPFGASAQEIVETTRRQNAEMDEACAAAGRDPGQLRRSMLLIGPLDPWQHEDGVARGLEAAHEAGCQEVVVMRASGERLERLAGALR